LINERKRDMTHDIKPDYLFEVWSPDDVAECIDGVNATLYARLWSLVPLLPRMTSDDETPDCQFKRALSVVWHHLTPAEQVQLNALAAAHLANEDTLFNS